MSFGQKSLGINSLVSLEQEGILGALEQGCIMTRFKRKTEDKKHFRIKLETREIIWNRSNGCRTEGTG